MRRSSGVAAHLDGGAPIVEVVVEGRVRMRLSLPPLRKAVYLFGMTFADALRRAAPEGPKRVLARALASEPIDALVRLIFFNRVPSHGSWILTEGTPRGTAARIFLGLWERPELYMTRRFLPRGVDVVELGGSLGVGTCLIAKRARRVVTVEANPWLAERLRDTLKLNRLDNVAVVNKAIHYDAATVAMVLKGKFGGGVVGNHATGTMVIDVPTLTLGQVLSEQEVTGDYVLVADVEGAEVPILLNEPETLDRCRMILIEMDGGSYRGKAYGPEDVRCLIEKLGFKVSYKFGPCAVFERP